MNFDLNGFMKIEYDMLKIATMYDKELELCGDVWQYNLACILNDKGYQRYAVGLSKKCDISMLNGAVVPSLLITNHEQVDKDILNELLNNIIFNYIDEKNEYPLMFVKDFAGIPYISLILVQSNLKLKDVFQKEITNKVILKNSKEFDYALTKVFLMSEIINIKYKKTLIDSISEEELLDFEQWLEDDLMQYFYLVSEGISCDVIPEEIQSSFDKVIELIDEKLEN